MESLRFARSGATLRASIFLFSVFCSSAFAQVRADSIWPTRQWQTSAPEEQGMDSAALARLVDFGTTLSLDSLLIARHGKIVLDAYYAPYGAEIPHAINSATKAVIGTLTAIATQDGLLDSADHRLLDFYADRSIANVDERKHAITLQSLLDMTSGIDWREPLTGRPDSVIDMERSQDWIKFILDRPMAAAPGDVFNYDSGNPHLLSAILTKLTGMSAADYAKAKLFGPLGIGSTWNWRQDPQGVSIGGYGLSMQPRDMAKLGYLYLRHGQWEDKPLVPPAWLDKVSHATLNMNLPFEPELRYSNFFWALPKKQFYMANGYHCQLIMVFSKLDIVAVTTARNFCPVSRLADTIAGAVKSDAALPQNPAGAELLGSAIRDISIEKPSAVGATAEIASAVSGKIYHFPANPMNVKSLSLSFADPQAQYDLEIYPRDRDKPAQKFSGPIGLDGLYRKSEPTASGIIATKGTWLNASTFVIERQTLGSGEQQKWTLSFDGKSLQLHSTDTSGREAWLDGELGG
jgi:CubicO group peptidase (beta-lactamase class C family)